SLADIGRDHLREAQRQAPRGLAAPGATVPRALALLHQAFEVIEELRGIGGPVARVLPCAIAEEIGGAHFSRSIDEGSLSISMSPSRTPLASGDCSRKRSEPASPARRQRRNRSV